MPIHSKILIATLQKFHKLVFLLIFIIKTLKKSPAIFAPSPRHNSLGFTPIMIRVNSIATIFLHAHQTLQNCNFTEVQIHF